VVEDLRFSMGLLHRDRGLEIAVSPLDGLVFRGDAHDLEEMIGNLMDNACKWAKTQISVAASQADGRLVIAVEDDGPGIPGHRRDEVLDRGRRLDETVAGSGLGLDIVQEIAVLYRGSLTLDESELGGLRARLDLPAAE
jgi:signal transduction histidine kinase